MKNNNQTLNNLMEDINVPIPGAPWIAKYNKMHIYTYHNLFVDK